MEAYSKFAQVYDLFMDNIDYEGWADYVTARLKEYGITDGLVLELGCGTGTMTDEQLYYTGDAITVLKNAFERADYTFVKFTLDKEGMQDIPADFRMKEGNITLYAQWKLTKYKITYKLNGGKNAKKNPTAYTYKTSTIKLKNPTRKGYVFKGWYLDKKFKKKVTVINKGSSGNKTLYAKWKKK